MSEQYVQVPVSLIERAPHAPMCSSTWRYPDGHRELCDCWKAELLALTSQPTPSAASPVRMTQGVTFTAHPNARRYIYRGGGTYRDESTGAHVSASAFDPSTIRDVTPPEGAS